MSRKAVLIEASKLKGQNDLPGARIDVENHEAFLLSAFGGSWESYEIKRFSHPTRRELLDYIKSLATSDYAFITFSGHGHHVQGGGLDESRLCINDTEEVAVAELYPQNPRALIVADSCREITKIEPEERSLAKLFETKAAQVRPNRQLARRLFDEAVAAAPEGPLYMYSCSIAEVASESNTRGGLFSRSLIDTATEWADRQNKPDVLKSDSAFRFAYNATLAKNSRQHPQYEGSTRRMTHFPYAIYAPQMLVK